MKEKIASIGTEAIEYIQDAESALKAKTGTDIILIALEKALGQ
ncbi:MAG: hypothetical protein RRY35_03385 [Clostridiales bacterium]